MVLSVLFGFAVVEITKTMLSLLPWVMLGVHKPETILALVILLYFSLNCVRYVWAHIKLSAFVPLIQVRSGREKLLALLHYLMFPIEATMFVAMALILTIPGVPVFGSMPPPPVRFELLTLYFDTLVFGFLSFNLLLALIDLAWCKIMERLLFLCPGSEAVGRPPDLAAWRDSSTDEVASFAIAGALLILATHLSVKDLVSGGGLLALYAIVAIPWVTMVREFLYNVRTADV